MNTNATLEEKRNEIRGHKIVSREEWTDARKKLLKKEKEETKMRDELSAERRKLPWVKIEKDYVFSGPKSDVSLSELFNGRSQLLVYHFMFGPDWKEGCPSCSFLCDHIDAAVPHLAARDVQVVMISRAPLPKIEAFKKRMGWHFDWVSSNANDFNHDFNVSFTPQEMAKGKVYYNYTLQEFPSAEAPGISVFYKNADGEIFHAYSTFGRGLDSVVGTYVLLDMVPKGRDEDHLAFSMEWVRHHDRYGTHEFADADKPYWPEITNASSDCGCGEKKQ